MKTRHTFFYTLLRPLIILYAKIRFGYTYEVARNLPEHYIVLSNHTTDYDLLFVAASFPRMMYFVASEHIARWKKLYAFLKFAFAPIMRPKGASAAPTIKEIMRTAKGGSNVCMFAEGVRSWDGSPSPISPGTAKMVKRLGCGLVTYRIVGGYFASPMWGGTSVRKGPIHGAPVHVYTKEQLAAMSNEEVYAAICADLGEDAYERQLANPQKYIGENPAHGLEYLLFTCPKCGRHDSFKTHGDAVSCTHCDLTFRYNEYGMLEGAPFCTLKEFADWQRGHVYTYSSRGHAFTGTGGTLVTLHQHQETPVDSGPITMSTEYLCCGNTQFPINEIYDMAIHGHRALVFTAGKTYYELVVDEHVNALKFLWLYHCCKKSPAEAIE